MKHWFLTAADELLPGEVLVLLSAHLINLSLVFLVSSGSQRKSFKFSNVILFFTNYNGKIYIRLLLSSGTVIT